jgi:hypothetical protein
MSSYGNAFDEECQALFSQLHRTFQKVVHDKESIVLANETRVRMDYQIRGLLENALKPGKDINKAVLEVIELLKPFTTHGKENLP